MAEVGLGKFSEIKTKISEFELESNTKISESKSI